LTPTKVPFGTYHCRVIHMKSKASTTTSSSITIRKDFRLVAHPNLSLHITHKIKPKKFWE